LLHTRNSDNAAAHTTELGIASSISTLKHVHDGAYEAIAILDQLALASKCQSLEEQAEASLHEHFITVEAEGEAQLALVKKFDNLHDVLAGIANGYHS
jgi:hypothetical protein